MRQLAIGVVLLCLVLTASCSRKETAQADVRTYQAKGVVQDVMRDKGQVRIKHEKIEGLMEEMTMWFAVKDPAALDSVRPGDNIEFTLQVTGHRPVVTDIRKLEAGR